MRPYRAIPIDGKDFVYGWYFERGKDAYIINNEGFLYLHIAQPPLPKGPMLLCLTEEHFIEVIPETVGQATGLKDKKRTEEFPEGQEIYEGDILIDNNEWGEEHQPTFRQEGDIVEVVWLDSEAEYMFENITNPKDGHMIMSANRELEIIGTIHTHPELLEK